MTIQAIFWVIEPAGTPIWAIKQVLERQGWIDPNNAQRGDTGISLYKEFENFAEASNEISNAVKEIGSPGTLNSILNKWPANVHPDLFEA